jgi:hypothetical protein
MNISNFILGLTERFNEIEKRFHFCSTAENKICMNGAIQNCLILCIHSKTA